MSSIDATERADGLDDITISQGTKRDADSLFVEAVDGVDDEEHLDDTGNRGAKRRKLEASQDMDSLLAALKLDANGNVIPYNAEAEGRPRLAIYHDSFKAAERAVTDICSEFMGVVEQVKEEYGCDFDEIEHICENNLKPLLTPQAEYPLVGPIALLGSAGIGKSSFTGCMLDNRGAAHESDGTKRGTNVVHEYSAATTTQKALFQVGAVYYNEDQVEVLVKAHCDGIFKFLSQRDELEEDEVDDLQKQYDNSIEFFQTLLCNQEDFESIEDAQGYFDERKEHEIEDVVCDLIASIEEFKDTRGLVDGVEYHTAESNEELAEVFKLVSRAPTARGRSQQPHPWPLIIKVQIHQDKELLKSGVVLADCPGITDSNQGVVNATMNYLKHAGTILIFEKIERIKDNPALDANIRACIRLGKRSNIRLVVTMIDHKQRNRPEQRSELSAGDRVLLNEAERIAEELKARKAFLQQAKNQAMAAGALEEYSLLDKEFQDLPKKVAIAEARIDQLNIEIRNREVAEHLRDKIKQLERSPHSPDLPVFFISNTQYQQHLKGYDPERPPSLDVQGTGVPSVRNMLFEIPARGKSNTLQRICCTALPVNLHGIIGILTKSPLARKEDVAKLIKKVLRGCTDLLRSIEDDLNQVFEHNVTKVIAANESKWANKASNLVSGWEKIKPVTFVAFCRRSGHWRPKPGDPMISWNNKIQVIFEDRLMEAFNALDTDIAKTGTNTITNITDMFSKLKRELEECGDFQGNRDADAFFKIVQHTRDSLHKEATKLFTNLTERLAIIRHSAVLEDKDKGLDSYVSLAMADIYEHCEMIAILERKGKLKIDTGKKLSKSRGLHAKRIDAIRARLMGTDEEKSLFAAVSEQAKQAFDSELTLFMKDCQKVLELGCQAVRDDFDRRFVVDDVKTEEDDEAAEVLNAAATKALGRAEGELKEYVEEFEAYEKSGSAAK